MLVPLLYKRITIDSKLVDGPGDVPKSADTYCFDCIDEGQPFGGVEICVYITPSGKYYHRFTGR